MRLLAPLGPGGGRKLDSVKRINSIKALLEKVFAFESFVRWKMEATSTETKIYRQFKRIHNECNTYKFNF